MKGVYDDAFILHDESADNVKESEKFNEGESKGKEQEGGFRQEALQSVCMIIRHLVWVHSLWTQYCELTNHLFKVKISNSVNEIAVKIAN